MNQISGQECSIIVPAYNEEKRIVSFLERLEGFPGELIFVCDGTDDTPLVIERFAGENTEYNILNSSNICIRFNH